MKSKSKFKHSFTEITGFLRLWKNQYFVLVLLSTIYNFYSACRIIFTEEVYNRICYWFSYTENLLHLNSCTCASSFKQYFPLFLSFLIFSFMYWFGFLWFSFYVCDLFVVFFLFVCNAFLLLSFLTRLACVKRDSEVHLEPSWTSTMEIFCENVS